VSPILFFLIIMSCASRTEPEWIISQPKAEGYWFGTGSVKKPFYGDDIREEARNKALSDLSTQISVKVSGTFKRVVTEHNLSLDDLTESITEIRVKNNLTHVENIDEYESKGRYYFLVRLSKATYYETIEKKRRNAVKTALG
ncbi:uncharacterized protein METZ01_LOCUS458974, partial [marine metagenome]